MESVTLHASNVQQHGHYLELIDLMLWCHNKGIPLQLFTNTKQPFAEGKAMTCFLQDFMKQPGQDPGPSGSSSSPEAGQVVWKVIVTRADFAATDTPWEFNHWVPLLPVGESSLKERMEIMEIAELAEKTAMHAVMETETDDSIGEHISIMHCLTKVTEKGVNLKRLSTRLDSFGHAPLPVAADGNCGVWSVLYLMEFSRGVPMLELLRRDPFGSQLLTESAHPVEWGKMLSLRQEIASMWLELVKQPESSKSKEWMMYFKTMLLDAGGLPTVPECAEHSEPSPPQAEVPDRGAADALAEQGQTVETPMKSVEPQPTVDVKREPASPKTPQQRRTWEAQFQERSPPVIKKARNSSRAGIVRERLVSGPAVPLRANLDDIMIAQNPKKQAWREFRVKTKRAW